MRQGEGGEGTPSRLPGLWYVFWKNRQIPVDEHRGDFRLGGMSGVIIPTQP